MKKDNSKFIKVLLISAFILVFSGILIYPIIKRINFGLDLKGGFEVLYLVEPLNGKKVSDKEVTDTYKSIGNRIDTLGVSEPEIIIEGNKIRVKLPGVTNESEARARLSTPAVLTFRDTSNNELMNASVLETPGAKLDYDPKTGRPVVALSIKDNTTFYNVTRAISESADNTIAIWLDYEEGDVFNREECGNGGSTKCISAATVSDGFSGNVIIQGNFTEEEANTLVDLINSGSLPTKLTEISTKTVDASFGSDALKNVAIAGIITLCVVVFIMVVFYRLSGLLSSVCLVLYTLVVFILFNLIDGVLTLTGIAALILGIGMAIDSSIITLEKIKEEVSNGKKLEVAYKEGNKRSLVSLIDANVTTFIAAVILFIFGESSVKGFATMLILTIIVTAFAMVILNRYLLGSIIKSHVFSGKEKILLGNIKPAPKREYLVFSKAYMVFCVLVILLGASFTIFKGLNLGVDFKGGSALTLTSDNVIDTEETDNILDKYDIEEKEIISDNQVYYKLSKTLEEKDMNTVKSDLSELNIKSDISVISNLVKKDLTKNAIISLCIAVVAILIYIAIRFTSTYAVGAIISIMSDVLITISLFAIFRIEINFIFVAGILTIIGYSINDTIVVFDIAREKVKELKSVTIENLTKVVNDSISLSLKRNILTSITTLTAIVALLFLSTSGVKEFNITVLIGLTAGTFSSLLLALYIWLKLEERRLKNPSKYESEEDNEPHERLIKGINS